jgi:MoCo/4Fe-4S cofactor protein with predicted Tat translocation signal
MADKKKKYWSTLEEYYNDPEVEKLRGEEFFTKPESVLRADDGPQRFNRRDFLKLGGAAAIFSMIACGSRPEEKIIPYVHQQEEIILGRPNNYASTCGECPAACGVVIKTREGKPIKMEGNPDHPLNQGKLCARGQAGLLNLYDPGRLRYPVKIGEDGTQTRITFAEADAEIIEHLKSSSGQVVLLTGAWHGPAREELVKQFLSSFSNARHIKYEVLTDDLYARSREAAFRISRLPEYHFEKANVVVLFGADLFANGRSPVRHMREFGLKRKIEDGSMSHVIAFEPTISEMGACADERYLIKPSDLYKVAAALVNQISIQDGKSYLASDSRVKNVYQPYDPDRIENELDLPHGLIKRLADELWEMSSKSLVISESFSGQNVNAMKLHTSVHLLNSILSNEGSMIDIHSVPDNHATASSTEMKNLLKDMSASNVSAIFIAGTNPAYSLPDEFKFVEALKKVPLRVSFADRVDETAQHCQYVLPGLHAAESWGDAEPIKEVYSLFQPTISPLWENRQVEDSLIKIGYGFGNNDFAAEEGSIKFYDFLKKYWDEHIYGKEHLAGTFESFWVKALQNGFYKTRPHLGPMIPARAVEMDSLRVMDEAAELGVGQELILTASSLHRDGRSMNNAWLLETPDPISRITWDNYLSIAPARANEMGLKEGDVVKLRANSVEVEVPVHIAPGTHKDVLALSVGWGRTAVGEIGNNIGINAFKLVRTGTNGLQYSMGDISIEKTGKHIPLACMQGHHYIEKRPILHEATLEEYRHDPYAGQNLSHGGAMTLWKQDHHYPGHKWGMVIDLNSCIGCNACMTACQVENNIPVVGKQQVLFGREMHWMRIDRYFEGDVDNPDVVHQPLLCHHCDKAPCETVCPVLATVHNDEGLNLQVYNRCVGTRYCSNNCPYKVRRFNYYDYYKSAYKEKTMRMHLNPDVTVRTRGVMEKCTFCIQRIREARHNAKIEGRPIADGEVIPACVQTCPTDALIFGDLNDPNSKVSKAAQDTRAYRLLHELNIDPSVAFLTLIRNRQADEEKTDKHESH